MSPEGLSQQNDMQEMVWAKINIHKSRCTRRALASLRSPSAAGRTPILSAAHRPASGIVRCRLSHLRVNGRQGVRAFDAVAARDPVWSLH